MPTHMYVGENGSGTILAAKRSAGVAQEVNLSEHVTCTPPPSMLPTLALKHRERHHQKSKTRVSVAPQKGLMSSQIKKKQKNLE